MRALLVFMVVALAGAMVMYFNLEKFGQPIEVCSISKEYFVWMSLSLSIFRNPF
jgi:hypothetical protein